ncbi:MAG TPA: chorismate synthase [Firmicutes bacterium]|nr:chorismate synthase [Bacillota bacterium]
MRYLTSGESHGPQLTAIIEGIPAGLLLTEEMINQELAQRQKGYGRGGRMKIETDKVQILGGVRHGITLGSPITLVILNKDAANWGQVMSPQPVSDLEYEEKKVPRPGHADLVGGIKYGHRDLRNVLERSSARETAIRVAVGAVAKQLLKQLDIDILAHVVQIGRVKCEPLKPQKINEMRHQIKNSLVSCADANVSEQMCQHIDEAKAQKDSLGGIVEIIAENMPLGLGSYVHYDHKLDAKLSAAVMSVQSVKGIHFGDAMYASAHFGSEVHDQITYDNGFSRQTNTYGGIEGGMTNGMPIVMKAFIKPIPTLYKPLNSVHIDTKAVEPSMIERSDTCVVPAAGVVLEAVVAIELAKVILETFHSDQMSVLKQQVATYREAVNTY